MADNANTTNTPYIPIPDFSNMETQQQVPKKTFWGMVKADPLPAVGLATTAGVLGSGIFAMMKGNARTQQNLMRARVICQGITIVVATAGLGAMASRKE